MPSDPHKGGGFNDVPLTSSSTILPEFSAINVRVEGHETQDNNRIAYSDGIVLPFSPITTKKPSTFLTGTPSSEQRPSKFRPNFSTPIRTQSKDNEPLHLPPVLRITNHGDGEPLFLQSLDDEHSCMGSDSFISSITEGMKMRFMKSRSGIQHKYMSAFPIKVGKKAGLKAEFTPEEEMCVDELILGGSVNWIYGVKRFENGRAEPTKNFNTPRICGVEELVRYQCKTASCKCEIIVARAAGGLIAYEKIDSESGEPYAHTGHDLSPEEQKRHRGKKNSYEAQQSKYDELSLRAEQQEYIQHHCAGLVYKSGYMAIAKSLIRNPAITVTQEQSDNIDLFAGRIKNYIRYKMKKKGKMGAAHRAMTGSQIRSILDHLHSADHCTDNDLPFLQTSDFECVQERLRISSHDYQESGGVFSHICFEFVDADARAEKAVQLFGDDGVQGEMDFFHVPGVDADWQVGHIGFSDHRHRYHVLSMIICHSENSATAGLLIKRAVQLITKNGGKLARLLVDGGTALNKAIGDENSQNQLLRGWFIEKRRCFAHIIRMPLSRGGGYRGGRGSLPKALLDNKVPRDIMGKIVAYVLMISYLSPIDHAVFKYAIQMLIHEFRPHFSDNIIKQYFNGNRNDLGGSCAGPAGSVASNQGGERRGGWMKKAHSDVLSTYCLSKTKNPVYFLVAAALDGERYHPITTEPNRSQFEKSAFKCLSGLANYNGRRGNFSSDWIYLICTEIEQDIEIEVPLHTCLGKKNKRFSVFIPSWTTQCNTLRKMLLDDVALQGSGPMALMQHCPSPSEVRVLTSTPKNCFDYLATIPLATQIVYKQMIRNAWKENTVEPKCNEKLSDYLRRHCHRDETKQSVLRFANAKESSIGDMPKQKKMTRKSRAKEKLDAALEAEKWNTSGEIGAEATNINDDIADGFHLLEEDAEINEVVAIAGKACAETMGDGQGLCQSVKNRVADDAVRNKDSMIPEEVRLLRELGAGTTV